MCPRPVKVSPAKRPGGPESWCARRPMFSGSEPSGRILGPRGRRATAAGPGSAAVAWLSRRVAGSVDSGRRSFPDACESDACERGLPSPAGAARLRRHDWFSPSNYTIGSPQENNPAKPPHHRRAVNGRRRSTSTGRRTVRIRFARLGGAPLHTADRKSAWLPWPPPPVAGDPTGGADWTLSHCPRGPYPPAASGRSAAGRATEPQGRRQADRMAPGRPNQEPS